GLTEPTTTAPAASGPRRRYREQVFTLSDALAYAQRYKRDFQAAKEDLYLSALALTLERHLWTPIFAADLRTIYGNFGEITDFDQAMRFVADLRMTQRLPYGGAFTAQMISTLIRDVKQSITAEEGSQIALSLDIPFLRNAGHIAREDLIQLERTLTYAVRSFERFRRRQLVDVMSSYFGLLTTKQQVVDLEITYGNFIEDLDRSQARYEADMDTIIDTGRAELAMLRAKNNLASGRERFRAQTDRFKLLIGMPVDEPIGLDDLQSISDIEQQVVSGQLPLLQRPEAVENEQLGLVVALQGRFDLLNRRDQIDDARRGVAIAKNRLLPDFDLTSSVTFDTDPDHFRLGAFETARATWRSEIVFSLPLERTAERNQYRRSLIDVQQAQRDYEELRDSIRADVRSALNEILLAEVTLTIQERSVDVAEQQKEFADIKYQTGDLTNREKVEAEDDWTQARNQWNAAKTDRWEAILDFRLATETLLIDENGRQTAPGP
ncbi:MAG: TolC family protein, partial [Planctomycetes bacterium]|nr:TolC family protein [Planctomycetota bacterium]